MLSSSPLQRRGCLRRPCCPAQSHHPCRKGLCHHQPLVGLHLLAPAGVAVVNIPSLPSVSSHSPGGTEHLEFQVSHCFWPWSKRCWCFHKQSLHTQPSAQSWISLSAVHSHTLPRRGVGWNPHITGKETEAQTRLNYLKDRHLGHGKAFVQTQICLNPELLFELP